MSNIHSKQTYIFSVILLFVGSMQMVGFILQSPKLRGLGFAYGAAPLPVVFSTVKGVDGFDTKHSLIVADDRGNIDTILLNQQLFAEFKGSFFLKNTYSIFLAYSHLLKPEQVEAGSRFMLCRKNIFSSFGIKDTFSSARILTQRSNYGINEIKIQHPECNKQ